MPYYAFFHCSHCNCLLPEHDQSFGFYRDDNDKAVCLRCFSSLDGELPVDVQQCFEAILDRMNEYHETFRGAMIHVSYEYGTNETHHQQLWAMYRDLYKS